MARRLHDHDHGRQLQQLTWTVNWQSYVFEQQINDATCRKSKKVPKKSKLRRRKLDFRSLSNLPRGWKTKMQKDAKGIQRQMIRVYDGWPGSRAHMRWRGSSGDMSPKATAQVSALRSSAEERSRFSSLLLNQSLAEVYNSWYLLITLEPLQSIDVYWCPLTKSWHRKSAHCQRFLFDALTNDIFGHRGHREARRPGDFCRALTKSPLWYMFSNSPCDLDTTLWTVCLWTVCHAVLSILFVQSIARCERDSIWIPCQSWKLKRFWSGWNQILQWLELDPHSWQHFWHGCSMLFDVVRFFVFFFWFLVQLDFGDPGLRWLHHLCADRPTIGQGQSSTAPKQTADLIRLDPTRSDLPMSFPSGSVLSPWNAIIMKRAFQVSWNSWQLPCRSPSLWSPPQPHPQLLPSHLPHP